MIDNISSLTFKCTVYFYLHHDKVTLSFICQLSLLCDKKGKIKSAAAIVFQSDFCWVLFYLKPSCHYWWSNCIIHRPFASEVF